MQFPSALQENLQPGVPIIHHLALQTVGAGVRDPWVLQGGVQVGLLRWIWGSHR